MKTSLLLLFIFAFLQISAQESLNFSIENKKVTWQKVFDTNLSEGEIKDILETDAILNPIAENLTGTSNPVNLHCQNQVPIYMSDKLRFFCSIEVKEGGYRVSISNMNLIPSQTMELWAVKSSEAPVTFASYQLRSRDGKFRKNNISQNALECLDSYFENKFAFRAPKEENW